MDVDSTVAVAPAEPSQGLAPSTGQAAPQSGTPSSDANSQAAPATPSEQTPGQGGTPKALWNDLTSAERDYKALQAEYTKTKQQMAKFGDLSEAEQLITIAKGLRGDPEFREWAQSKLAKMETGRGDPETVEAVKLVKQLAAQEVQQAITPLMAHMQAARLAAVTQAMDRKHPDWAEHKERVRDTIVAGIQQGIFPQSVIHNMSLEFLEKVYAMTIGLDEEHQAKVYGKRLAQKHAATTQSTPGTAPTATSLPPVKDMHEALARARKQQGS